MADGNFGEGLRIPSFRQLEEKEVVSAAELLISFSSYAEDGWAINGDSVIGIAERTGMNPMALSTLGSIAYLGVRAQFLGGKFNHTPATARKEASEYAKVLRYARERIQDIAFLN
jgi:hypothetical protein